MFIKKLSLLFLILIGVNACSTNAPKTEWFGEYSQENASRPNVIEYGTFVQAGNLYGTEEVHNHHISVLLPLSGDASAVGKEIQTAIELAVLERQPKGLSVSFYDTAQNPKEKIEEALSTNPDLIIGPVFANDVEIVKSLKPENLPVLSFTSNADVLGNGILTMALMPANSVEKTIKEIQKDGINSILVLAPDNETGRTLAGVAYEAADVYNINISGLFYYKEKDTESIKSTTYKASMNEARTAANTRAREILSDILTKEQLTAEEKESLTRQLDKLSKLETLGKVPYKAVLFLGSADDTESLVSFLRYYGITSREAKIYGTTMWDGSDIANDFAMSGAKYTALVETSPVFTNVYELTSGKKPIKFASFGYDAMNIAINALYSGKQPALYLLDPSGFIGTDGLFRLTPNGESQRTLKTVKILGSGNTEVIEAPEQNFIRPVYNVEQIEAGRVREIEIESDGINPMQYIKIPERFYSKYSSKSYGAHHNESSPKEETTIIVLPEDDSEPIVSEDFKPVELESVNKTYIDSIEVEE